MGVATDANRSTGGPASDPGAAVGRASDRRTVRVAGIVALTVIAVAGGLKLAYPFSGDQALLATGGREVLHGAVLYRDFWDVKQPAIYLFYAVGGAIFGFSPFGLHLRELIYILVFAVVLQRTSWLLALVRRPEDRMRSARDVVADAGAIVAGFLVPIVAFLAYFRAVGQLSEIRWTYFTFTPKTTGIAGPPISRLTGGAKDFAEWTGPALVLATVGFVARLRRGWSIWWTACAGWVVLSVPLFLIQQWWLYQYCSRSCRSRSSPVPASTGSSNRGRGNAPRSWS